MKESQSSMRIFWSQDLSRETKHYFYPTEYGGWGWHTSGECELSGREREIKMGILELWIGGEEGKWGIWYATVEADGARQEELSGWL